jgi:hypothetical protein
MAIRAAGFLRRLPRLAPAPPDLKTTKKSTIPMRRPVRPEPRHANRPVGPLAWTAEEHQKYKRTTKWPGRTVEVPDGPPGLTLTSLPSEEYLRGYVAALRTRGAKGKIAEDIALILKLLDETGGNVEQARALHNRAGGRALHSRAAPGALDRPINAQLPHIPADGQARD